MPSKPERVNRPWIRKSEPRPWQVSAELDESQKFYQSMAWRNFRNRYIKEHPLCVECHRAGHYTPGYVVDHITPIRKGGAKFSDMNLQTLCEKCHNKKRAKERHDK